MKIAVVGCLHGELDVIYERIEEAEKRDNIIVDLLLVCGDFQAIRNENDLKCMAVPDKYKRLGTFYRYYFGEKLAPKLTILIGGNHEASNYLQTLPYGGWVAPNMYYMGYCSVVQFGGLRIGGISGIFNYHHSKLGHFERLPFNPDTMRSIYHMRETEVYKLLQLSSRTMSPQVSEPAKEEQIDSSINSKINSGNLRHVLDIFMSHDWPVNIHECGNVGYLLKRKPYFKVDIDKGRLGNPLLQPLVWHLKPKNWFAAHLHVCFRAEVSHCDEASNSTIFTHFQALDKVVQHRNFLQIFDIFPDDTNTQQKKELYYDTEWLTILKKTDHLVKIEHKQAPGIDITNGQNSIEVSQEDINEICDLFQNDLKIPENFTKCEPVVDINRDNDPKRWENYINPQTAQLCKTLSIHDPNQMLIDLQNQTSQDPGRSFQTQAASNPDEIDLSESDCDDCFETETKKAKVESDLFFIDTKGKNQG